KAVAAEEVMASLVLRQRYTLRKSLLNRKAYLHSRREILAALRAVNAGGHALDLILANKGGRANLSCTVQLCDTAELNYFPTTFSFVCGSLLSRQTNILVDNVIVGKSPGNTFQRS